MIAADTDNNGFRTYRLPQALADVAVALFPSLGQCRAVFHLAKLLTWADVHTAENIALNCSHDDAVRFARERIDKSVLTTRHLD